MSMEHTLTVRLEVWDGDATEYFLLPMPVTGIMDVVHACFEQGAWTIRGNEGGTPFAGRGEYKQEAILNYLRARLGFVAVVESAAAKAVGDDWTPEEEQEWDTLLAQPHVQAGLARRAEEAERQIEAGEIEEGGFAVEDES